MIDVVIEYFKHSKVRVRRLKKKKKKQESLRGVMLDFIFKPHFVQAAPELHYNFTFYCSKNRSVVYLYKIVCRNNGLEWLIIFCLASKQEVCACLSHRGYAFLS